MFIDTQTANSRAAQPRTSVARPSTYDDASTPLLEAFVGQDAPPTYLEATSPGLETSWPHYEDDTGLLPMSARQARDRRSKEKIYNGRSRREKCLNRKTLRWAALVIFLLILGALLAEVAISLATRDKKNVRKVEE